MNANVNLIPQNKIQIKSGITTNVDMSAKIRENVKSVIDIIFEIQLDVFAKMVNI